jgi:hypothetical protein
MACLGECGRCRHRGRAANPGPVPDGDCGARRLPDRARGRAHAHADVSHARRDGDGMVRLTGLLPQRALSAVRSCGAQQQGGHTGLARSGSHCGGECPSDPCRARRRGAGPPRQQRPTLRFHLGSGRWKKTTRRASSRTRYTRPGNWDFPSTGRQDRAEPGQPKRGVSAQWPRDSHRGQGYAKAERHHDPEVGRTLAGGGHRKERWQAGMLAQLPRSRPAQSRSRESWTRSPQISGNPSARTCTRAETSCEPRALPTLSGAEERT